MTVERSRRRRRAEIAAGAWLVLDHDILAPGFGELLREIRPSVSIEPPAGNAMTMRTRLLGKVCAEAAVGTATMAPAIKPATANRAYFIRLLRLPQLPQ